MRKRIRYLTVLISILGLVVVAWTFNKDAEAASLTGSAMAESEERVVEVGIEPVSEEQLKLYRSGYRVHDFHVRQGERVRWINRTKGRVVMEISDHRIFRCRITQEVERGEAWTSPPVDETIPDGRYEYSVYLYENRKYADGDHSNPGMIIP